MAQRIVIKNISTLVSSAGLTAMLPDLQTQITRDFAPFWGRTAELVLGEPSGDDWRVIVKDLADDPNALGFHLLDLGIPEARIFVKPTLESGNAVSGVMSHELLEMLADPQANRMAEDNRHIIEVCDPVETTGYMIGRTWVSNFVNPEYFGFPGHNRMDFCGLLRNPVPEMLPGGYIMEFVDGQWVSHFARTDEGRLNPRASELGRSYWRAKYVPLGG